MNIPIGHLFIHTAIQRRNREIESFFNTQKSKYNKEREQNRDESDDSTKIGINKTDYPIHSDLALDQVTIMFFDRKQRKIEPMPKIEPKTSKSNE